MVALLDAIRDFVLALALSWVGIAVQPKPTPKPDQSACPVASGAASCSIKAGFDASDCSEN